MRYFLAFSLIIYALNGLRSQSLVVIGELRASHTKLPVATAIVQLEGNSEYTETNALGSFELRGLSPGPHVLVITAADFSIKRIPIELDITKRILDLGSIYLDKDITSEKAEHLITLTETDLSEDEDVVSSAGLLQATRDVYLSRAAFDFSQAFFRVRGYDSGNGTVLINGIGMNKLEDRRPQWNNWGGLNDITRNQEFSYGLQVSENAFGGLLGVTNIDTRPSRLRPGTRLSSSASNRTYTGRLMATHSSGSQENGLSYAVAGSRRWAREGYIDGTLYDAYSIYGSLEYLYNKDSGIYITAILASNRRGQASAITEEVFELAGNKYNPYWGLQDGQIRNSRVRKIQEPLVMLNNYSSFGKLQLRTGIAYQFGNRIKSRLGYYNAPNPDPTYYRYLPSFYLNSPIGANYTHAALAKEGFLQYPQLVWEDLYRANRSETSNDRAAYVLYEDTTEEGVFSFNSTAKLELNNVLEIDLGVGFKNLDSKYYARIKDLLGAPAHLDTDTFSNTVNDLNGTSEKLKDEIFNYNYKVGARVIDGFLQLRLSRNEWEAFISGTASSTSYFREGFFLNEKFPMTSLGKTKDLEFLNFGIKGGITYKISGRHWITTAGYLLTRAPIYQNVFVNPREHNEIVPGIQSEKISSLDINYNVRSPQI